MATSDPTEERMRQWQAELRAHREHVEARQRASAPPLGLFVAKSWLKMLEQMVRRGQAAQALHMLAMEQAKPMRMPTLAEWP